MAFYDRFFDRLEDIYREFETNRRTSSRRRYTDSSGTGYRYSGTAQKKREDDDPDLRRYDGLYHAVKRRGEEDGEDESPRGGSGGRGETGGYETSEGYGEERGFNPLRRRKREMEERARLAGANRPGHVYDDIEDTLDEDGDRGGRLIGLGRSSGRDGRGRRADGDVYEDRGYRDGRGKYPDGMRRRYEADMYDREDGYGRYERGDRYGRRGSYDRRDEYDRYNRYDRRGYGGERRRSRYDERRYDDYYDDYYDDEPDFRPPPKKRMSVAARLVLIVLVAAFFTAQTVIFGSIMTKPKQHEDIVEVDYASTDNEYEPSDPEAIYTAQAKQIVSAMSVEQKVGQLIVASSLGSEGNKLTDDDFCALVSATDATGVILRREDCAGRSKDGMKKLIERLQQEGGGELFVMAEEEGGAKVALSSNSSLRKNSFRSAQAMYVSGGLDLIAEDASEKSEFLLDMGVNVNITPLCDVVTSTGGFMYSRAYGKGASDTSEYVRTVTARMKEKNIGCVLKYFPGYGNSPGDTRNGLIVISTVATVIRERDLLPFRAGIEAKADAVMMSHAIVTEIDDTSPASLSPTVIGMLRNDLGFDGVVMCEPLSDEGLSEYTGGEDMSVKALCAGVDLLFAPSDAPAAKNAVYEAVVNGTVSQERLDEAVTRIIRWKLRLGIIKADG